MKKTNKLTKRIARKVCSTGLGIFLTAAAAAPNLTACETENGITYALKTDASEFTEQIDYSNIPNLNEQPLRVIRKAVEGEWKIIYLLGAYQNSFVTFTQDSVIFRFCESVPELLRHSNYRYSWEIQAVDDEDEPPFDDIYGYVMRRHFTDPETSPSRLALYFKKIQNDTLYGTIGPFFTTGPTRGISFVKTKEGK